MDDGDDDDNVFDSFDDDNVEELILLTARNPTPTTRSQLPTATPSNEIEVQLQSAQGENAILRSKLEFLEKQKQQDLQKLKEQYGNDLSDKISKIQAYQELTIKLEDEKKFLKSELTSLSTRPKPTKKRKLNDSKGVQETTEDDVLMTNEDIMTTNTTTTIQSSPPLPQVKVIQHLSSIIPNEKQLFIEEIYNHVINGASDTTMNFLARIGSPIHFEHETFIVELNNNIAASIINYLIQLTNNIRLDNLISEFIEILTIYIQKLYLNNTLLSTPFLLSLVHCSLNYRPSALHRDIIEQLLQFNSDFLKNYLHILRPTTIPGQHHHHHIQEKLHQRKKNLQYVVLDQFIVLFSLDIIELLSKLSYTKQEVTKLFWKLLPKEIIKSGLSVSSSINCVFNIVEILTYSINSIFDKEIDNDDDDDGAEEDEYEEDSFIKDDDILLSMTKLLIDGMPLTPGFRIYGLNRIIGNNDDLQLLERLVSQDRGKVINKPLPILDENVNVISLENKLKHELQALNIKLKILKFFEIFFTINSISNLKFEFVIELLRILVWVLLKEQEYTIRNPRSETVYLRNSLISSIVKLIHFIILENEEIPQDLILQKLSNDDSYNFIIALTRISFSSDTNLSLLTSNFLQKLTKNFEIPIFNKSVEYTNYLQNNISITTSDLNLKKLSICQNNNGLEVSFDDDIIEMSRDLIELYTTAIELDNLYFAMNKVSESNEIDELMMEYLNDDNDRRE